MTFWYIWAWLIYRLANTAVQIADVALTLCIECAVPTREEVSSVIYWIHTLASSVFLVYGLLCNWVNPVVTIHLADLIWIRALRKSDIWQRVTAPQYKACIRWTKVVTTVESRTLFLSYNLHNANDNQNKHFHL